MSSRGGSDQFSTDMERLRAQAERRFYEEAVDASRAKRPLRSRMYEAMQRRPLIFTGLGLAAILAIRGLVRRKHLPYHYPLNVYVTDVRLQVCGTAFSFVLLDMTLQLFKMKRKMREEKEAAAAAAVATGTSTEPGTSSPD